MGSLRFLEHNDGLQFGTSKPSPLAQHETGNVISRRPGEYQPGSSKQPSPDGFQNHGQNIFTIHPRGALRHQIKKELQNLQAAPSLFKIGQSPVEASITTIWRLCIVT